MAHMDSLGYILYYTILHYTILQTWSLWDSTEPCRGLGANHNDHIRRSVLRLLEPEPSKNPPSKYGPLIWAPRPFRGILGAC